MYARAYAMLSRTAWPSRPKRSAICTHRSGRNVPSVSMNRHLPSPPPCSIGSWHVTASVWHSCVLPVRNSPNTSVSEPVSSPPPSSVSISFEPVVRCSMSARCA